MMVKSEQKDKWSVATDDDPSTSLRTVMQLVNKDFDPNNR